MDDIFAYIDVPGVGLKKVMVIGSLDDVSDIGSLDDVYITTTEGKKAIAVLGLTGGGGSSPFSTIQVGDVLAGDYTEIEEDGTIISFGQGTTWDEIAQSVIGRNLDTASGRIDYNYDELTIDYASNARYPDEVLGVVSQMPHARKLMTPIRPHIHWIQNQSAQPNILIEYRVSNNGEGIPATWELKALTASDNIFPYVSGNLMQITEFNLPDVVGEDFTLSGTFDCKIYRDVSNSSGLFSGADTYTGVFSLKYYDIHYVKDMNGSREEFVK